MGHYVLSIGAVFGIFAGVTFWFEVITGVALNDTLTKAHFYIMFAGVNLTFFPQHFLGLQGIPRRYSDYPDAFSTWNVVRSSGRLVRIVGVIIFAGLMWTALRKQNATAPVGSGSVEFRPRLPTSWHTFNESTVLG